MSFRDTLGHFSDTSCIAFLNMHHDNDSELLLEYKCLKGIFYLDTPEDILIKGINAIFNGEYWFSRILITRYLKNRHRSSRPLNESINKLTKKELKILQCVAKGDSNEIIAKRLCLSVHTIKTHVYNIFRKIGVNNRIQAVNWMTSAEVGHIDDPIADVVKDNRESLY
jgi:LuxR family transcriptional regulator of csgAB operon